MKSYLKNKTKSKAKQDKKDWRHGSSGRTPA
jgi:hypothetical protein